MLINPIHTMYLPRPHRLSPHAIAPATYPRPAPWRRFQPLYQDTNVHRYAHPERQQKDYLQKLSANRSIPTTRQLQEAPQAAVLESYVIILLASYLLIQRQRYGRTYF